MVADRILYMSWSPAAVAQKDSIRLQFIFCKKTLSFILCSSLFRYCRRKYRTESNSDELAIKEREKTMKKCMIVLQRYEEEGERHEYRERSDDRD